MKTKLSERFWVALSIFGLIGQVAWVVENMYFNVFIYKMFRASASDISLMVAASAVSATLTTVFMGALSDRIGKRKIFISAGYILWGISILSFAFVRIDVINALFPFVTSAAAVGINIVIILDCVMTFFGSTANDAAFNAWVTDSTDATNRGSAEGINSMMPLVAILVVFGGFMAFNLDSKDSWVWIFSIIGAVVLLIGIIGCFLIKDPPIKPTKTGYIHNIFYGFKPSSIKENKNLYASLFAFIIFNTSIQIFMPYLIIYYEQSLKMKDYVLVMAPAIILASVFTAFWGKVYDKKGFKFSLAVSLSLLAVGYIILFFTRRTVPVFLGSLSMMCGYLSGMAVFGARIRDNTPEGKAGMLQGIRIFSQVLIPGILGPSIGAFVLKNASQIENSDGTLSFLPNENIFLAALIAELVLVLLLPIISKEKTVFNELRTPFEKDLTDTPFSEYPRPQMKRDSFINLNGKWRFSVKNKTGVTPLGEILVPFPPESRLSGINKRFDKKDTLVYEKEFRLDETFIKDRVLLNFGAVDQYTKVFVNGKMVGENKGGYIPFTFDITDFLNDSVNLLMVEVRDPLDTDLPYGKQTKKRGGMWYTEVSGIWQTVWLESVPENYIKNIKITPDINSVTIEVIGGEEDKTIIFEGKMYHFKDTVTITPDEVTSWTPDTPKLYDFTLISGKDKIDSYFALRKITIENNKILLNGKPFFFHGLLDQGYFPDGIFLPATPDGFKTDILKMKELGFNMLRKHIKIEPEIFYYYCDKYGMIVFQDLVNSGKYSFLIDTALPTVFLKKGFSHKASERRKKFFEKHSKQTVELLYNHPSICYYTLFNEGWGQFDAKELYKKMKKLDSTRVWDATSGWFQTGESDVLSEHIYFKPLNLKNDGRPLVLSEFGGYCYKIPEHSFNPLNTYGYKICKDAESFNKDLKALYVEQIMPAIENGLCASVLTQVSDVEDEVNGLFTYDRQVLKADNSFKNISKALYKKFYNS